MTYTQGFKSSVIRKVKEGRTITEVAGEIGISTKTLQRWIKDLETSTVNSNCTPSHRPEEKLSLLLEGRALTDDERGEWLRIHGLHTEHFTLWEQELKTILTTKQANMQADNSMLRKEIKQLQKELARKEKALAEAAILITLKKNYPNVFAGDEGS